ncbi:hypothetical protein D3C84_1004340 [compost metagenome]
MACPSNRGRIRLEPNSGHKPRLTNGMRKRASALMYTKSQCSSMVVPMPTAAPATAAITGLRHSSRLSMK